MPFVAAGAFWVVVASGRAGRGNGDGEKGEEAQRDRDQDATIAGSGAVSIFGVHFKVASLQDVEAQQRSRLRSIESAVARLRSSPLCGGGLAQPVIEPGLAQDRAAARNECALSQHGAEVARLRVSDYLARVIPCTQGSSDEGVQLGLFGSGNLYDAVGWRTHRDLTRGLRDIIRRYGLEENRCHANGVAVSGVLDDVLDELEELRRMDERVRNR